MSLRVWLPLNGTLDNQGLDNVTVTNNGATVDNNGKVGKCYSFGTGNSYIIIDSTPLKTFTEFSFACWVKIISWNTNYSTIFAAKNSTAVSWNNLIFSLLRSGSNSNLCFNISDGHSYTSTSCYTGILSTNTWYHIVCTYEEGKIKLYQDGNIVNTYNTTIVPNFDSIANLWIGKSNENSYQSNNLLNDVRIYDHALSPMEVKEISKGLILHYPLNRGGWGQENLIVGSQLNGNFTYPSSSYKDWYSPTTTVIPSGSTYTLSFDAKSTVSGDKVVTHYYSPNTTTGVKTSQGYTSSAVDGYAPFTLTTEWQRYWVTYTQSSTTAVKHLICPRLTSGNGTGTVSVKNVKFEEGSIATPWCPNSSDELAITLGMNDNIEYDCSGYCNNGTRTGTFSWTSDTPKYNVSTKFSANTIKNTIFNFTSNIWTVAFWYYYDTAPSTYQGFLCLSRNTGGDADKKLAAMPKSSYIWFKFENTNLTVSSLKIKVWTHIVMTFDGTNGRVYENGVLKGTTGAASSIYTNCDDFVIGARANAVDATTTTCQLVGNMSDVRVYATALSADDVKSLYNNSAYIDNQGNIYGAVYEEV